MNGCLLVFGAIAGGFLLVQFVRAVFNAVTGKAVFLVAMSLAVAFFARLPEAIGASDLQAADPKIGVYQSEANAAEYKGIHQTPLPTWLEKNGYTFQVFGDRQASDPGFLGQFCLVTTTSCYVVPDAARAALVKYVKAGGQLLWIDGPARCRDKEFLSVLGIDGGYNYRSLAEARFRIAGGDHFVREGVADFQGPCAGNPALEATGNVLATWAPAESGENAAASKPAEVPAVVVTESGAGRAVMLNWIVWLTPGPETEELVSRVVEYLLAGPLLKAAPFAVRVINPTPQVAQPAELSLRVRLIGRSTLAGKQARLSAVLVSPQNKPAGPPASQSILLESRSDNPCRAEAAFTIPTEGLSDGRYRIAIACSVGQTAPRTTQVRVRLHGQEAARRAAADAERSKLLLPVIQGTLGDYDAEPRTKEGRVDIPRLFERIEAAQMNMYDFLIWHAETDWEDFQVFLPQAQKRGLKVWITLVPPSEPPPSKPFGLDYVRWADEIGKLSQKYDNLVALVIDDFWSGSNRSLFTPAYIGELSATLRRHNPRLAFLPTVYWGTIGNQDFIRDYGHLIDGIVFPYADLESTEKLPEQLTACREWLGPSKMLLINVYASGSSGAGERGPRTAQYMRSILTISRQECDGIRIYCLPKSDFNDHRFQTTAELYGEWRAKDQSGKR